METKQKIFVTIGTAAVVAAAIFGGATFFNNAANGNATTANSDSVTSSRARSTSSANTPLGSYKDGTYIKTISYAVPHGDANSIKVTLTVSGGNITNITTDETYTDPESFMYIDSFDTNVRRDASGQSLANYSPTRIGGASLTTEAFAEAIRSIRTDAAA